MPNSILQQNRRVDDDHRRRHQNNSLNGNRQYHYKQHHHHVKELMNDSSDHTRSTAVSSSTTSTCSNSIRSKACSNDLSHSYLSRQHHPMINKKKNTISNDHLGQYDHCKNSTLSPNSVLSCQDRLRLYRYANTSSITSTISNNMGDRQGEKSLDSQKVTKSNSSLSFPCNRAQYVKTGNALWNDVEYYEYTIPVPINHYYDRPPRILQHYHKQQKKQQQQEVMSEFARSAYLTSSYI
jgi:hypothetical protein